MGCGGLILGIGVLLTAAAGITEVYRIAGFYNGCSPGQLYEIQGGGVLECQDHAFSYGYEPKVLASGREVILIGEESVRAYLHNGSVVRTRISGQFDGCRRDWIYSLDNGLVFQCSATSLAVSLRPEVEIFVIEGREPVVLIDGKSYVGTLYRAN